MTTSLSQNTQVILLLTAPLIMGRNEISSDLLTQGEYKRLARFLHDRQRQPADLLAADAQELFVECQHLINTNRINRLLNRGFLLSQAIERWQTRAIWIVSRADAEYPQRYKTCLKDDAPPVLYGCGEIATLDTGGLAVVGSRHVDDELMEYAEGIGQLAAKAGCTIVSGGARGIDQAAMRGALDAKGKVVGVLADSLERTAMTREHRELLMDGYLVLISPYDPSAGFNVGHAMQRNKLLYALADAALVVCSDYEKGGTWGGAVEQLEKLHFVTVYVRSNGETSMGIAALQRKGALPWPNPETPEALTEALTAKTNSREEYPEQLGLSSSVSEPHKQIYEASPGSIVNKGSIVLPPEKSPSSPANDLFDKARELLLRITAAKPKKAKEVADELQVSESQARTWLDRLVEDGVLKKNPSRPVRYQHALPPKPSLFDCIDSKC